MILEKYLRKLTRIMAMMREMIVGLLVMKQSPLKIRELLSGLITNVLI